MRPADLPCCGCKAAISVFWTELLHACEGRRDDPRQPGPNNRRRRCDSLLGPAHARHNLGGRFPGTRQAMSSRRLYALSLQATRRGADERRTAVLLQELHGQPARPASTIGAGTGAAFKIRTVRVPRTAGSLTGSLGASGTDCESSDPNMGFPESPVRSPGFQSAARSGPCRRPPPSCWARLRAWQLDHFRPSQNRERWAPPVRHPPGCPSRKSWKLPAERPDRRRSDC